MGDDQGGGAPRDWWQAPLGRRGFFGHILSALVGFGAGRELPSGRKTPLEELIKKNLALKGKVALLEQRLAEARNTIKGYESGNPSFLVINTPITYDFDGYFKEYPKAEQFYDPVMKAVTKHKDVFWVNPLLLLLIIKKESANGHYDVSRVGAVGPVQLIPDTAEYPAVVAYADSRRKAHELIVKAKRKGVEPYLKVWRGSHYEAAREAALRVEGAREDAEKYLNKVLMILKSNADVIADPDGEKVLEWLKRFKPRTESGFWRSFFMFVDAKIVQYRAQEEFETHIRKYLQELGVIKSLKEDEMKYALDERLNPEKAIDAATLYLAHVLRRVNGNPVKALAHYNSGRLEIPPFDETRKYIDTIINDFITWHSLLVKTPKK